MAITLIVPLPAHQTACHCLGNSVSIHPNQEHGAMYKEFYGLREYPFNMTPDPQFLFLSRIHRVALDMLLYGIRERKGFIAITGEVGAGKTTLCRALLNSLDATTKTALILNPSLSDSQILRAVSRRVPSPASQDHEEGFVRHDQRLPAARTGGQSQRRADRG